MTITGPKIQAAHRLIRLEGLDIKGRRAPDVYRQLHDAGYRWNSQKQAWYKKAVKHMENLPSKAQFNILYGLALVNAKLQMIMFAQVYATIPSGKFEQISLYSERKTTGVSLR